MEYFQIRGAGPLRGETAVSGAKNAALPILAACVLCRGPCVLYNCPEIADVETTLAILRALGAKAERCGAAVVVDAAGLTETTVPAALAARMRSSVLFAGALLSVGGSVKIPLPGGCPLGERPINYHLWAFEQLGAKCLASDGYYEISWERPRGAVLEFPHVSVGATENGILAALRAMEQCGAGGADTLRRMTAFLGTSAPDWVQIDPTDWSGRQNALLATLMEAILSQSVITFDYYGETGAATARRVCPRRLWFKGRTWYLLSFCLTKNAMRTFKLTRIKRAQIVPGAFPPQALAAIGAPPQKEEATAIPKIPVVLSIDARMAYRVYDDFEAAEITHLPDGSFLVRTAFPPGAWILSFILGYGDMAQVLEPEALRSEVRDALQKTLALYEKT